MSEFQDWCNKPEVVLTGNGWGVRISGCDVFDPINQHGVKSFRAFDVVKGLATKEEAESFLAKWLKEQLPGFDALSAVTAERDRLQQFEDAYNEWHEKTEWVQETAKPRELGKHRADVLKERIDQLRAEADLLRKDAERWRYVRLQGDDTHWLNLLRVDLEDFGGNVDAAVDALIDGDSTAMAAKEG